MGSNEKRAAQRAARLLKGRREAVSESRPGATGGNSGGSLPLKRGKAAALGRQFGWYHGAVFVPFAFKGGDGGFFCFRNPLAPPHKKVIYLKGMI